MSDEETTQAREEMRAKWRRWSRMKRERMTPEQVEEAKAKAHARRAARLSTPEGREKQGEQDRRWRANNRDKVKANRERDRSRKREKAAAARAALMSDPEYLKKLEEKKAAAAEKARATWRRYYQRRRKKPAADPEALKARREEKIKKALLTEQEKADRARRRKEERVKAQRLLEAKKRAEREAQIAAREAKPSPSPARPVLTGRRMGRLEALMKWR